MRAWEIEMALTANFAVFDRRRYLVVPNISWGLGLTHECDLLCMTPAQYLHEVEIKVSVYDLKRDADKRHGHSSRIIKWLWFAGPAAMEAALLEHAPAGAGVICVGARNTIPQCVRIREATVRPEHRKITAHERYKLARLGYIRYWDAREALERVLREHVQAPG